MWRFTSHKPFVESIFISFLDNVLFSSQRMLCASCVSTFNIIIKSTIIHASAPWIHCVGTLMDKQKNIEHMNDILKSHMNILNEKKKHNVFLCFFFVIQRDEEKKLKKKTRKNMCNIQKLPTFVISWVLVWRLRIERHKHKFSHIFASSLKAGSQTACHITFNIWTISKQKERRLNQLDGTAAPYIHIEFLFMAFGKTFQINRLLFHSMPFNLLHFILKNVHYFRCLGFSDNVCICFVCSNIKWFCVYDEPQNATGCFTKQKWNNNKNKVEKASISSGSSHRISYMYWSWCCCCFLFNGVHFDLKFRRINSWHSVSHLSQGIKNDVEIEINMGNFLPKVFKLARLTLPSITSRQERKIGLIHHFDIKRNVFSYFK